MFYTFIKWYTPKKNHFQLNETYYGIKNFADAVFFS